MTDSHSGIMKWQSIRNKEKIFQPLQTRYQKLQTNSLQVASPCTRLPRGPEETHRKQFWGPTYTDNSFEFQPGTNPPEFACNLGWPIALSWFLQSPWLTASVCQLGSLEQIVNEELSASCFWLCNIPSCSPVLATTRCNLIFLANFSLEPLDYVARRVPHRPVHVSAMPNWLGGGSRPLEAAWLLDYWHVGCCLTFMPGFSMGHTSCCMGQRRWVLLHLNQWCQIHDWMSGAHLSGVIRPNRFARFARIGWFARIGNSSDSGESPESLEFK